MLKSRVSAYFNRRAGQVFRGLPVGHWFSAGPDIPSEVDIDVSWLEIVSTKVVRLSSFQPNRQRGRLAVQPKSAPSKSAGSGHNAKLMLLVWGWAVMREA